MFICKYIWLNWITIKWGSGKTSINSVSYIFNGFQKCVKSWFWFEYLECSALFLQRQTLQFSGLDAEHRICKCCCCRLNMLPEHFGIRKETAFKILVTRKKNISNLQIWLDIRVIGAFMFTPNIALLIKVKHWVQAHFNVLVYEERSPLDVLCKLAL